MRRVPSLRGLQAFEAVARTGSLAGAAAALGITASAVSHRIRGLEAELGVSLLRRTPRGFELGPAGLRYRGPVEQAFRTLADATAELLGPDPARPLTISLISEFGLRWLMPRFARFRALHPELDFAIRSGPELADLAAGEADIAVRHGLGRWPGLVAEPLLLFSVTPVCAPSLVEGLAEGIAGRPVAAALAGLTVLRVEHDDWEEWLAAAGAAEARPKRELWFGDYSMALAAALAGEGLLLGYTGYVEAEIAAGALDRPFAPTLATGKGHWLVYVKDRLADPRVRAFRDWALAEAAGDGAGDRGG
jgi:LysR family glycine cleavage system transcriptional activator